MVEGVTRFEPHVFVLSRTTRADANSKTFEQRADSFAAALSDAESAVLVAHRTTDGMASFVIVNGPGDSAEVAAKTLAQAVGGRAEPCEYPDTLGEVGHIAEAVFNPRGAVARQAIIGADPAEVARRLESNLAVGEWTAVVVRRPTDSEDMRFYDWFTHRLGGTASSAIELGPEACIVSMLAGSSSAARAKKLVASQLPAALPGFTLKTKPRLVRRRSDLRPGAKCAAAGGLVALAVKVLGSETIATGPESMSAQVLAFLGLAGAGLAGLGVVLMVLRGAGLVPGRATRLLRAVGSGEFDAPGRLPWWRRPKAPTEATVNGKGKKVKAKPGSYPLHPTAFKVAPMVFAGMVAPYAEAQTSSAAAGARVAPPVLLRPIGPRIGLSGEAPVYRSTVDEYSGVAVLGRAGSGKSLWLFSQFGWACAEQRWWSPIPGAPGPRNTLIAFENKGDGVASYQAWADAAGIKLMVLDLMNPATFAVDLFATAGDVSQRAESVVNAMVYAFEAGDIQNRSFVVLHRILTAALVCRENPEIGAAVGYDPSQMSEWDYANILVGNVTDADGVRLAAEILGRAKRPETATADVRTAAEALGPIYDGRTESQRRNLVEAAQNKVEQLARMRTWWSPTRRKVSWAQVLGETNIGEPVTGAGGTATTRHRAVVLNLGSSDPNTPMPEKASGLIASLLMYSLQRAMLTYCSGWQTQGRSVSIYADELSMLAGSSTEIITWLKDQGRSYGVRPILATQRPAQLAPALRKLLLNFGTLISFNQEDRDTAGEIAAQLSAHEGEVSADDLIHLPKYTAIVRTYVDAERQAPFTLTTENYQSDPTRYFAEQGYPVDAPIVSTLPDTPDGSPVVAAPAPAAAAAQPIPVFTPTIPSAPAEPQAPADDVDVESLLKW